MPLPSGVRAATWADVGTNIGKTVSLLREIINDAAGGNDIARLLRKCLILAHTLDSLELAAWAKAELNGYPDDVALPNYRILHCRSKGQMVGPFNSWQGEFEIPLWVIPEDRREAFSSARAPQPIAHYQDLLENRPGSGPIAQPWPTWVARKYAPQAFIAGTQCLKAWNEISASEVVAMLDQVKSRILEFALAISKEFPELINDDELLNGSNAKGPQVSQTFNTTIMGSVGNVAAGSTNVSQVSALAVEGGHWESLRTALTEQGLPAEDIDELRGALEKDKEAGETGVGSRVQGWLGKLTAKAMSGTGAVAVNAIGGAIAPLIGKYLGIA